MGNRTSSASPPASAVTPEESGASPAVPAISRDSVKRLLTRAFALPPPKAANPLESFAAPTGIYGSRHCKWGDAGAKYLVATRQLAPRVRGCEEDDVVGMAECPVCCLGYPSTYGLNFTACCSRALCTECFLFSQDPGYSMDCPYCHHARFSVNYSGDIDLFLRLVSSGELSPASPMLLPTGAAAAATSLTSVSGLPMLESTPPKAPKESSMSTPAPAYGSTAAGVTATGDDSGRFVVPTATVADRDALRRSIREQDLVFNQESALRHIERLSDRLGDRHRGAQQRQTLVGNDDGEDEEEEVHGITAAGGDDDVEGDAVDNDDDELGMYSDADDGALYLDPRALLNALAALGLRVEDRGFAQTMLQRVAASGPPHSRSLAAAAASPAAGGAGAASRDGGPGSLSRFVQQHRQQQHGTAASAAAAMAGAGRSSGSSSFSNVHFDPSGGGSLSLDRRGGTSASSTHAGAGSSGRHGDAAALFAAAAGAGGGRSQRQLQSRDGGGGSISHHPGPPASASEAAASAAGLRRAPGHSSTHSRPRRGELEYIEDMFLRLAISESLQQGASNTSGCTTGSSILSEPSTSVAPDASPPLASLSVGAAAAGSAASSPASVAATAEESRELENALRLSLQQ